MKQTGLEYLIDKILFTNESYLDDEGELTDVARTQYFNSYKSHVDLTEHVNKAREIDARRQILIDMMASDEELGLYNECTCDKCGKESRGSHSCPYDEEFNGGHSDSCNCCDGCRRECLMDI